MCVDGWLDVGRCVGRRTDGGQMIMEDGWMDGWQ